jgi:type I restriction enzyme S subunit
MTGDSTRVTTTGGREATTRHIPPKHALAVGMPSIAPPARWRWSPLSSIARLESGHTPSRKHPEYWGGPIPWISIQDARESHGRRIDSTLEHTNDVGIANSSARILPKNTVCLSRTASVGYVVVMGRPMATSQDFVNWVCTDQLNPDFLKYVFIAEGKELLRFASGSVHQTIYFPAAKAFHICHPSAAEQSSIVAILDQASEGIAAAKANAENNLENARAIFDGQLQSVFTQGGEEWVETTIGEQIRFIDYRGKTPVKTAHGIRLITAKNVKMGFLQDKPMEYIAADNYRTWMTRGIPEKGDVLFTTEAPLANVAQLDTAEKVAFAQRIIIMQTKAETLDSTFLKYLLLSQPIQHRIRTRGTGATVQGIKASLLKTIEISFPRSLVEQKRLVTKLEGLRDETQRLASIYERKLAALDALKKSLLHCAFMGELTAKRTSELIEAVA